MNAMRLCKLILTAFSARNADPLFKTRRSSVRATPRGLFGSSAATIFHSSSERSKRAIASSFAQEFESQSLPAGNPFMITKPSRGLWVKVATYTALPTIGRPTTSASARDCRCAIPHTFTIYPPSGFRPGWTLLRSVRRSHGRLPLWARTRRCAWSLFGTPRICRGFRTRLAQLEMAWTPSWAPGNLDKAQQVACSWSYSLSGRYWPARLKAAPDRGEVSCLNDNPPVFFDPAIVAIHTS